MEYLTRILIKASKDNRFRFHPLCKSLNLINLCFADDLIIFCKATTSSVQVLIEAFAEFGCSSSLKINYSKSHIYFGGVSAEVKTRILVYSQLVEGTFPLKYLGVPLRPTKWKSADCDIIFKKIQMRLNSVVKDIDKVCRQCLWGESGSRSKFHFTSWEQVCQPKPFGGLGFREGAIWNKLKLANYLWAIESKQDQLWVKWVNCVYLKGVSLSDYIPKVYSSWYWRKLMFFYKSISRSELQAAVNKGKLHLGTLYTQLLSSERITYERPVWCKLSVPKHRFILWQAINQHLLTRDLLASHHIPIETMRCPVCDHVEESHDHLFFDCIFSRKVLLLVSCWLGGVTKPGKFAD
ncbi:uncharacterized protein LOC133785354 [Humulus lupulus]|uniref:uncharacterized protein LOC133785354 n=1 Tax=Humulus lupulus TaxID=3486 RepID=UPI002B400F3D|nr:uncharacterized protein LOC133785354 [Humulus lupulus]